MQNQPVLNRLDLKITLSVLITIGLSWIIPWLSPLPAAISALLCVQGGLESSFSHSDWWDFRCDRCPDLH